MPRVHKHDPIYSHQYLRASASFTERVPPGHPIILLKSNKFNMAAVSVKRSILMHFFIVLNRILL